MPDLIVIGIGLGGLCAAAAAALVLDQHAGGRVHAEDGALVSEENRVRLLAAWMRGQERPVCVPRFALIPEKSIGATGFEPATCCSQVRRPRQLPTGVALAATPAPGASATTSWRRPASCAGVF